jgi:ATP-dependent helicase/nuclease subunit B
MKATLHVVCGPARSGKTARLLGEFVRRTRADPGTTLWLVPTRRAADDFRERLRGQARGLCGFYLRTFEDLVAALVEANDPKARPLAGVQRRLLVEEVLADLRRRGELPCFGPVSATRGFAEALLGLLGELARAGVGPAEFARAAASARDREAAHVYARYREALAREGLHDAEAFPAHAAKLLRSGPCAPFEGLKAVFVDGFTDFSRAQWDLLERLAEWVEELWVTLPDEPGEERAELFARPRHTRARLERLGGCAGVRGAACGLAFPSLPPGLAHLERQLFRPPRAVQVSADAAGLFCIEAPGPLGEARLVARQVKALLLEGAPPDDVLLAARDLAPYADLLREVFDEYGVPLEVEGTDPLTRSPAVALLLRAARLPEDGWPFAPVTALLRHTYFRPDWPEARADAQVPLRAEALLRLLGEPRGREAYLSAAARWAEQPQPGLEDEGPEESRRRRTHELAARCLPFLARFFRAWDEAPDRAPPAEHVTWLRAFADDLGISRAAGEDSSDSPALASLWDELGRWQARGGRPLDRPTFLAHLGTLAAGAGLPRTPRGPGRVRLLSASQARHLSVPHLFVLGLGERSFPRPSPPPSLLDDPGREALGLPAPADPYAAEMLLFYQLVTRATRRLVLSRPACDEKGQELLPSPFLLAALACFAPGAVPVERRRMLLDGYGRDTPLSMPELRVRAAAGTSGGGLPPGVWANLRDAAELARSRFDERAHGPYDGLLRDARVVARVAEDFGPQHVFSPTALEDYVACPFRFFLRHALRLEPLEEPREEVELTRRGQAVHRALARAHRHLDGAGLHSPGEEAQALVLREVGAAIEEDVGRAPSASSRELWRLEGRRLLRALSRYGAQWQKFLRPWSERGVAPRPRLFEVGFGLPGEDHGPLVVRADDVEVRVSGRIDRVDLAELDDGVGFWVIDYKTGRAGNHTGADLAEFRRLQLTLYALAVESVLLADCHARPLGLAYWLVSESGPKVALPARDPARWLEEGRRWPEVRDRLRAWVATLARHIRAGAFPLAPRSEHCTQSCPFGQACRITQARPVGKVWDLPLPGG